MEKTLSLLFPGLMTLLLARSLLRSLGGLLRLLLRGGCGFACLWLLNTLAPFTGLFLPINAVTVLTVGTLGLPGIALVAFLAVL